MTPETKNKPTVGISSCLLGEKVRFDGESKLHPIIVDIIGPHVEWVPICPEVEVGMGVPREPVNLVGSLEFTELLTVQSRINWSAKMNKYSRPKIQSLKKYPLNGFIFKSASPSCGLGEVKVFKNPSLEQWISFGTGIFAKEFIQEFPDLPVVEENTLKNEKHASEFIAKIKRHHRLHLSGFEKD
jgi:uncharacterized protein YbbK (DUF523 family)